MLLTLRLARGRITAVTAGLLAGTVGASPFIESFTLSGELLASLPAVVSLLCFCFYLEGRDRGWPRNRLLLTLAGSGVLTGIAVLVKQSAFDAGLAAIVFLLWRERKRGVAPASLLLAGAIVPIGIAAASAARLSDWLYAVVGYRFQGDSMVTGSIPARVHQLWLSLPPQSRPMTKPAKA